MRIRCRFNNLPLLALLGTAMAADAQVKPQLAAISHEGSSKKPPFMA
jgi:hypothetical protein